MLKEDDAPVGLSYDHIWNRLGDRRYGFQWDHAPFGMEEDEDWDTDAAVPESILDEKFCPINFQSQQPRSYLIKRKDLSVPRSHWETSEELEDWVHDIHDYHGRLLNPFRDLLPK